MRSSGFLRSYGLLALNMSDETKKLETGTGRIEIPGRSLLKIK